MIPHADEARDPISVKALWQHLLIVLGEWLHNPLIRFYLFLDILGSALWRSVGMAIILALILEAIVWSFLHQMPMLIDIGVAVLGLIVFLSFARWVGSRRIFYGLWLLFVSLGLMIGVVILGLSLNRPSPTGVLLGCLVMVLCWHPLKREHDLGKAIELPPAEQKS